MRPSTLHRRQNSLLLHLCYVHRLITDSGLLSAANRTGMLANVPWLPTFSPLKKFASSQLLASVRDQAAKAINDPGTSPLARRQYSIQREWLDADDVAILEFLMFPGQSSSSHVFPPTPGSAYMTVSATLLVQSHPRILFHVPVSDY